MRGNAKPVPVKAISDDPPYLTLEEVEALCRGRLQVRYRHRISEPAVTYSFALEGPDLTAFRTAQEQGYLVVSNRGTQERLVKLFNWWCHAAERAFLLVELRPASLESGTTRIAYGCLPGRTPLSPTAVLDLYTFPMVSQPDRRVGSSAGVMYLPEGSETARFVTTLLEHIAPPR